MLQIDKAVQFAGEVSYLVIRIETRIISRRYI